VLIELLLRVQRIDDDDDAVEHEVGAQFGRGKEGLGDGAGVGQPGRFDEDPVERQFAGRALSGEILQTTHQIGVDRAADAAVAQLDDAATGAK
jgi:hypothetical protein